MAHQKSVSTGQSAGHSRRPAVASAAAIAVAIITIWLSVAAKPLEAAQSAVSKRYTPFLVEEEGSRRLNRPAECTFGKTIREVGSTWFADLGPPFGVMYCIKCECLPTTKKRRIVARVQCRNIKNDCPKVTCDDPVRVAGRCCKVCPGEQFNSDIIQDAPQLLSADEEEKNMKYYGALLTGRTSSFLKRDEIKSVYSTNNPLNHVATARFTFHKKNLYYSFYVSARAPKPRQIQFIDDAGRIMEEHQLLQPGGAGGGGGGSPFSVYQNSTDKICGVWRRVPRDYRKMLRDDLISVVLLWSGPHQAELALAGRVSKYPALATELFSSLLEPAADTAAELMSGSGGTAIISTSSGATSSIHMTFVLNGLFGGDEIADVPLSIRLESVEKRQVVLEDVVTVQKPANDYNVIEFSSPLSPHNLRLLTRGKLVVVVNSRKHPELRIQGGIATRVACEHFQALLAPPAGPAASKTRSSGLAWVYLNRDGNLVYNVYTDSLNPADIPMITMTDDSLKRRTELEDLTPAIHGQTAIGVIERVGPKVLEAMYADALGINVATETDESLIRGRLVSRMVADARDSPEPILLKRPESQPGAAAIAATVGASSQGADAAAAAAHLLGMAWLSVDAECTLHYEITLGGSVSAKQTFRLYLEEIPIEAPGAPVSRRQLDEWSGYYLEGFNMDILATELAKLETSVVYVEVRDGETEALLLRGKLKSMKIPQHCAPYTDNDVPGVYQSAGEHNDNNQVVGGSGGGSESHCFDSKRFHKEGDQWKSEIEECTMCSCLHGLIKCEAIKCPPLKCKAEERRVLKDECCASCVGPATHASGELGNLTAATRDGGPPRGCHLGDQFHVAGSSWHPYLPPNGFDTCAVCTCDLVTLNIMCPRVQCPSLSCPDKIAYRPDKKACCKLCPDVRPHHYSSSRLSSSSAAAAATVAFSSGGAVATGGAANGAGAPLSLAAGSIEKGAGAVQDKEVQQDEAGGARVAAKVVRTNEEMLAAGGCSVAQVIYENGQEWHPILPTGEQKCVKCRCKDNQIECIRKRCSRSVCNNSVRLHANKHANSGNKKGAGGHHTHHNSGGGGGGSNGNHLESGAGAAGLDECCSVHCRRTRRHQNKKRLMREQAERHKQHAAAVASSAAAASVTASNSNSKS